MTLSFFFFFNLFIMVPVNTTDQCKLYYEPGMKQDTYDMEWCYDEIVMLEGWRTLQIKLRKSMPKQRDKKKKVGAQHWDTY